MSAPAPRPLGPPDPRADGAMVRTRDGVRLATDVYLPAGAGPFPTILTRLPYDKTASDCFIPWVAGYLTGHGFAFVAQDTRGKGRSEGEPVAFVHERDDGWDTLEWIAAQPWNRGGVAMWGESYFGFTQWAAAASGHPALRAIVPRNTTTAIGGDWLHRQGVPRLAFPLAWAADTWMDAAMYGIVPGDFDWGAGPAAAILPALHGGRRSASLERWQRGTTAELEAALGLGPAASRLGVPALHIGGWYDIFARGQLADWGAASGAAWAPQQLIFDATDHAHLRWGEGRGAVDLHEIPPAEIEAFMPEYLDPSIEFYDAIFRTGAPPAAPTVRWRPSEGDWCEAESWPPPGARRLTLHAADGRRAFADAEGGSLAPEPDRERHGIGWSHDPADPVPSVCDDELQAMAAPPDDRLVQSRPDVATFTSDPFAAGLELAGPARARLAIATTGGDGAAIAKLLDVAPDGSTRRLRDGAARHEADATEAGVTVELGSVAHRLAPGHRLRLEVASSSHPRFLPPGGDGLDPWTEPDRAGLRRLITGGALGTALELTTVDGPR